MLNLEGFLPTLHVILGALIALEGTFVSNRYYKRILEERYDRKVLLQINEILLEYPKDIFSNKEKEYNFRNSIRKLSFELSSKRFENLALNLTRLALNDKSVNEHNISYALGEVQKCINPELLKKYKSN